MNTLEIIVIVLGISVVGYFLYTKFTEFKEKFDFLF